MRVGVIDYGGGNLASVLHALARAGADPMLVSDPDALVDCDRLVLPGVGSFRDCMDRLNERQLPAAIRTAARDRAIPLLGICVGMQVLATAGSEHGDCPGVGLIPGTVRRMATDARLPHIGWNDVAAERDPALFNGMGGGTFYFAHSFAVVPDDSADVVIASFDHGPSFPAAVATGSVLGVQFHPEKSQHDGLALLRNFLRLAA